MKIVFTTIFLCMTLLMNAQENKSLLVNKTFTTNIGSICEETPDDNPCAGQQIYLVLEFKKEEVFIVEKYISSCNIESIMEIGNYKWTLLNKNQVKIDANPKIIEYIYLEELVLEFNNGQLLGKRKNENNSVSEYIFKDVSKQNKTFQRN